MKKIINFILSNYKQIIFFICIIIFLLLTRKVFKKELIQIDITWYNYISKYIINDKLTSIIKIITNLGGAYFIIGITFLSLFIIKNKKINISIIVNLLLITSLNIIIKSILQRPRPSIFRIIEESGYSFPSGHSMISMAFYGFFIYLIFTNIKNKYIKIISITSLSILIILIGFSRVYLGVHYVSDVIAGFIFSLAYLILYTSILNKYYKINK